MVVRCRVVVRCNVVVWCGSGVVVVKNMIYLEIEINFKNIIN